MQLHLREHELPKRSDSGNGVHEALLKLGVPLDNWSPTVCGTQNTVRFTVNIPLSFMVFPVALPMNRSAHGAVVAARCRVPLGNSPESCDGGNAPDRVRGPSSAQDWRCISSDAYPVPALVNPGINKALPPYVGLPSFNSFCSKYSGRDRDISKHTHANRFRCDLLLLGVGFLYACQNPAVHSARKGLARTSPLLITNAQDRPEIDQKKLTRIIFLPFLPLPLKSRPATDRSGAGNLRTTRLGQGRLSLIRLAQSAPPFAWFQETLITPTQSATASREVCLVQTQGQSVPIHLAIP
jgi:hypothetical protein